MANSIPLTFRAAPFPEGYVAGPEQMKNDLVARLYAESTESISFFASGSVAPSSNVGPWLKNGEEWYVWSSTLAMYVPQVIGSESLGYVAQLAAPDPTIYTFWIELNGSGKAIAIKYYSGGAWKDVYEDKFAAYDADITAIEADITSIETDISTNYLTIASAAATYQTLAGMSAYAPLASPTFTGVPAAPTAAPGTNTTQIASTAFVTAAIAGIPGVTIVAGNNIFRAVPSSDQDIVHGGAGSLTTDVSFGTEVFDPDSSFAANVFTAPADGYYQFEAGLQMFVQAGAPTDADLYGVIVTSGGQAIAMSGRDDTATGQVTTTGSCTVFLSSGQTVKVQSVSVVDAACTIRIGTTYSFFSGFRIR
jgi:hypothetical protein